MVDHQTGGFANGAKGVMLTLAIGLGLVVVLLIGQGGKSTGTGPPGSSFATTARGAKAAYLLLERLGHPVQRRAQALGRMEQHKLVFLLSPDTRLEEIDGPGIDRWLHDGGTLVYGVDGFEPSAELLRATLGLRGIRIKPSGGAKARLASEWAPARNLTLHALVRMSEAADADLDDHADDHTDAADDDAPARGAPVAIAHVGNAPAAFVVTRGKGRIYLVDARVFSNEGLKSADHALFLAVLAARHAGGGSIAFDEYAHGYGSVPSVLGATAWPLQASLLIAGIALLLYALAVGRRLGPASPEPQPARHSSIEQIETLAAFYAAQGDRQTALVALAAHAGKPVPMPPPRDDRSLLLAAQALIGPRPARVTQNKGTAWPSTPSSTPPPK